MDVKKRQRTIPELEKLLDEQLRFLELSAESYDVGFIGEAKRLATTIRVLIHDTGISHSLLSQLNKKNRPFLDTTFDKNPESILNYGGLISLSKVDGNEKPKYIALLDEIPPPFRDKWIDFVVWWTMPIFTNRDDKISREKIILTACNQDGGAHVDPKLDVIYDDLVSGSFMGSKVDSPCDKSLIAEAGSAAIRQISHEVLKTLKPGYSKKPEMENTVIFSNPSAVIDSTASQHPGGRNKIGRNDPCPCGSGKKFKKCHG